jgi:sulfur carrier protein
MTSRRTLPRHWLPAQVRRAMTNLTVNGESLALEGAGDISSLLKQMGADPARVAIMVNDRVVARDGWSSVTLVDGDRLEVLIFAGGG